MKEKELIELGFEKVTPDPKVWEDENWHYYTYDFGNGSFSLISDDSTAVEDDKWYVEVFEDESIRFTSKIELQQLIALIEKNTIKK